MEARPRRGDPWIYGLHGPEPPRHPRKRGSQFVWPRDKPHSSIFGRWKELLSDKGPDIWVTRRGSDGPHRPVWSGWRTPHPQIPGEPYWDNLGYKYVDEPNGPDLPLARGRSPDKKYNFRTRKYEYPDIHTWTDVKYCDQHRIPIYQRGIIEDDERYDLFFEDYYGVNPFEYDRRDPWWNWDEYPHVH